MGSEGGEIHGVTCPMEQEMIYALGPLSHLSP